MPVATSRTASPTHSGQFDHIIHSVLSLDLGGLERLVLDLVQIGVRRGQRMSVVCIEREGLLADEARRLGAEVWCLDKPPGRSSAAIGKAAELLAKLRPDVVHTHQIGAAWYLGHAAQRVGVPAIVHTEHSDHVTQAKTWFKKLRARMLWRSNGRLVGRFCCVSPDVANSVTRWGTVSSRKVAVVLNGIDVEAYGDRSVREEVREALGIPRDAMVVGSVGRMVEVKRQDLLIRALSRLRARLGDVRLLLVGDGPESGALKRLAVDLGVANQVAFAGYQAAPQRFYAAMDAFAMTSRHEGLPLALLEAWASRLPVVCSAVGGMKQAVADGENGLLFPNGDADALTDQLSRLLESNRLAGDLAFAGYEKVREHYSLERMADEYSRQYELARRG